MISSKRDSWPMERREWVSQWTWTQQQPEGVTSPSRERQKRQSQLRTNNCADHDGRHKMRRMQRRNTFSALSLSCSLFQRSTKFQEDKSRGREDFGSGRTGRGQYSNGHGLGRGNRVFGRQASCYGRAHLDQYSASINISFGHLLLLV